MIRILKIIIYVFWGFIIKIVHLVTPSYCTCVIQIHAFTRVLCIIYKYNSNIFARNKIETADKTTWFH